MLVAKNYPYNTDLVSERAFTGHIALYKTYIDTVNAITTNTRGMKTAETYAMNGVTLHEAYLENIGKSGLKISSEFHRIIANQYGNYETWIKEFIDVSALARAWCAVIFDPRSDRIKTILMDEHDKGMTYGAKIILIIDLVDHAYWPDYLNNKIAYINNFMDCINWPVVEQRIKKLGINNSAYL